MTCYKRHDQWINLDKFKTQKSTSTAHSSPSHYWEKISAMHKIFKMLSKFYSAKINLSICEYYSHFRENLFCVRLLVLDYMWIWFLKCRFISGPRCHTQLTGWTRVIYHTWRSWIGLGVLLLLLFFTIVSLFWGNKPIFNESHSSNKTL